jgi:hypothetical protein
VVVRGHQHRLPPKMNVAVDNSRADSHWNSRQIANSAGRTVVIGIVLQSNAAVNRI